MKIKLIIVLCVTALASIYPQPSPNLNSSEIKLAIKKLGVLGSVLYVAAHPDDENTAVISYLAKGKLLRTGYLSLTRGDGGQNLIGSEQSELLGVIRTQELIEARKRDGGEQFFSRAIDFGYSKSSAETFEVWDKQKILSDVVWVIRKFKPDVIITRFPPTGEGGHGHHTASAILALEAFDIANDPNAFPEQLRYLEVWQPKRIFWNAWLPALQNKDIDLSNVPVLNLGEFNALLGKSYTEISALSRSMHKSQGFGSSGVRNDLLNYFLLLKGDPVTTEMFKNIDMTWNRIDGGSEIQLLIDKTISEFDQDDPSASLNNLIGIYHKVSRLNDEYWKQIKLKELKEIIRSCAGIWIEAISNDEFVAMGDTLKIKSSIVKRCKENIILKEISINDEIKTIENGTLNQGELMSTSFDVFISDKFSISNPYWLNREHSGGSFYIDDQQMIGEPESRASFISKFKIEIFGETLDLEIPVYQRLTDPVDGEIYRPVKITPPAVINLEKDLYFFNGSTSKEIKLTVQSFKNNLKGKVFLEASNGWRVEPKTIELSEMNRNQKKDFYVNVFPLSSDYRSEISAKILIDGYEYSKEITRIDYKHIMPQTIFNDSKAVLESYVLPKTGIQKIGYISGSGDLIPNYLTDLGFNVIVFDDKHFSSNHLNEFDVIISGIRAYNTRDEISVFHKKLLKYVEDGGTLISQYNTTGDLIWNPGLYPLKLSRDRVTDEKSNVEILNPEHKIFNYPFKITKDDFHGWVQERGLYFPNEWDEKYEALLSMNDKGEDAKSGSLLYTKYGKGTFIYTGLSFFRQIPAGVEGAVKLFINLIHSGN